jgi:hypothetical protein
MRYSFENGGFMTFSLIVKHDDETWVLQHRERTVCEGSFEAVKSVMVDAYNFYLEDIHDALVVMEKNGFNHASFGYGKRFVVAKWIDDHRTGRAYSA